MTNGTVNTGGSVSLSIAGDVTMSNSFATSARGFNAQGVTGTIAGNLSLTASANQAASVIGGRAGRISDGSISLTVGGGITMTASHGSAEAGIGYGVLSFSQPASFITNGDITVTANGGDIVLSGIGDTRIGHYNSTTTQGAVTIQSSGSISLTSSGTSSGDVSVLGHLVNTNFIGSNPMLRPLHNSH